MVIDGLFLEVKEHRAGYDIVDCDSVQRAVEIAARLPEAAVCGVEVRPTLELTGAGVDLETLWGRRGRDRPDRARCQTRVAPSAAFGRSGI